MENIPDIIRAFSEAGVSGWMLWVWLLVFTAGVAWTGHSWFEMKKNLAEH